MFEKTGVASREMVMTKFPSMERINKGALPARSRSATIATTFPVGMRPGVPAVACALRNAPASPS